MTAPNAAIRTGIRLPVITRVDITGYQLYPGVDGTGLHQLLRPGVTVIAGINGLGKTTLLHALYRVLTGPADTGIPVGTGDLGARSPKTTPWATPSYFKSRVEDEAIEARIAVEVVFGERHVTIARSLRDLRLLSLQVDDTTQALGEPIYRTLITELTGFTRFEDFLFCLQYLMFVTEDRPALVWDRTAQFELFRVLVADAPRGRALREQFDNIQRTDSARRNLRAQYNRIANQLRNARARLQGDRELRTEVEGLQRELEMISDEISGLSPRLIALDTERHRLRERRAQAARDFEEATRRFAATEQQHFQRVLPDVGQTAALVFLRSDRGCLICDDRSDRAARRLRTQLDAHHCPFCDSPIAAEVDTGTAPDEGILFGELTEGADRVEAARNLFTTIESELKEALALFGEIADRLAELQSIRQDLREQLRSREARLPPTPEAMAQLDATAQTIQQQLDELLASQAVEERHFGEALAGLRADVEALKEDLQIRFHNYASAFLAEQCSLVYSTDERRIGQEGERFAFPRFSIFMTSAVSPDEGRRRTGPVEVSESQREFIDLAFRMALIEVAAGQGSSMLVLETPEASLDSIFMARAGQLLREFAYGGVGVGNRLVATSNLTEGRMISALLGAIGPDGTTRGAATQPHFVPADERASRVLNLLAVAAPSRALRDFRDEYERAFQHAVYPERTVRAPLNDGGDAVEDR